MDMEEKYMEPIKLKSNPSIKAMELKPYFNIFFEGRAVGSKSRLGQGSRFSQQHHV